VHPGFLFLFISISAIYAFWRAGEDIVIENTVFGWYNYMGKAGESAGKALRKVP
jgi:hypothetical protein